MSVEITKSLAGPLFAKPTAHFFSATAFRPLVTSSFSESVVSRKRVDVNRLFQSELLIKPRLFQEGKIVGYLPASGARLVRSGNPFRDMAFSAPQLRVSARRCCADSVQFRSVPSPWPNIHIFCELLFQRRLLAFSALYFSIFCGKKIKNNFVESPHFL